MQNWNSFIYYCFLFFVCCSQADICCLHPLTRSNSNVSLENYLKVKKEKFNIVGLRGLYSFILKVLRSKCI